MAKLTQHVDRRDAELLRLYSSEVGRYALLTKDDEVALAQRDRGRSRGS